MSPKVSIITITYNRARYIKEAIESVLVQSFGDWELIIIDDASTDNTPAIVQEYAQKDSRIRYFRNETNLKIPRSRNLGLKMAEGKYIAVLDSDDVWAEPDKLRKQVEFLENNPEYALVGGGVIFIDENGREISRRLNPSDDKEIRRRILFKNPFVHSGVLYLRKAALESGGYDENLNVSEDYDLWLKMGRTWKFANLNDYLVKYRIYSAGQSASSRLEAAGNTKMLVKKYKNIYPGYFGALAAANLRIILYSFKREFICPKNGAPRSQISKK